MKRWIWILGFFLAIGGMALNFAQLTLVYLSKDATVTMSVVYPSSAVFPVVSLCNMSPVKKSSWQTPFVSKEQITTKTKNSNDNVSNTSSALPANDSVSTDSTLKLSDNDYMVTLHSDIVLPSGNETACNMSMTSAYQKRKKRTSKIFVPFNSKF